MNRNAAAICSGAHLFVLVLFCSSAAAQVERPPGARILLERAIQTDSAAQSVSEASGRPPVTGAATEADRPPVVEAEALQVHRIRATTMDAYVLGADRRTRAIDPERDEVLLGRNEVLVSHTADAVQVRAGESVRAGGIVHELPVQLHVVDAAQRVRTANLMVEYTGGGLRLADEGPGFFGEVFVWFEDAADRTAIYDFPQPASVLVTADVHSVEPPIFPLHRTNEWERVMLRDPNPAAPVPLKVRGSAAQQDVLLELPVVRRGLAIRVDSDEVDGFGLAVARLTIEARGVPNPAGRQIALSVRPAGVFEPPAATLNAQGIAETTLRSVRTGPVVIDANSPGLDAGSYEDLTFIWPIWFLVASIGGGLLGAAIRVLGHQDAAPARQRVALRLLSGALIGLAVTVLYAIGVSVTPIEPLARGGEALVFGLALAGSYWGMRNPAAMPASA